MGRVSEHQYGFLSSNPKIHGLVDILWHFLIPEKAVTRQE